jgi:hypothetical protein
MSIVLTMTTTTQMMKWNFSFAYPQKHPVLPLKQRIAVQWSQLEQGFPKQMHLNNNLPVLILSAAIRNRQQDLFNNVEMLPNKNNYISLLKVLQT